MCPSGNLPRPSLLPGLPLHLSPSVPIQQEIILLSTPAVRQPQLPISMTVSWPTEKGLQRMPEKSLEKVYGEDSLLSQNLTQGTHVS